MGNKQVDLIVIAEPLNPGTKKRPVTQAIMVWEMIEPNGLTEELERIREEGIMEFFKMFFTREEINFDLQAVIMLLGAGWLVITSDGNRVKDLIETGRRFQRMALTAREKIIDIHPMIQVLEEKNGQKHIKKEHESGVIPQFMLRVGYLNKYPDPVSLRKPVEWFVRS